MKTSKDYMAEANAVVKRLSPEDGIALYAAGGETVFVDVRDSAAVAQTGTIKGAARIPRGIMEFAADDSGPMHNPVLKKDVKIGLICGAGGQAALAGKTLVEMGYTDVVNLGGIQAWKDAGGPVEAG